MKAKIELDPRLPAGYLRRQQLALPLDAERICSTTLPLCVATRARRDARPLAKSTPRQAESGPARERAHARALAEDHALEALSLLEHAYRRLVFAAGLPEPLRAWAPEYGSPAVTWELQAGDAALTVELTPIAQRRFSGAAVFCRSGVADGDRAVLERAATLCLGEAIAARLDAAESPRSRRAYAQALAWELDPPSNGDAQDIARANAFPQRAALGREDVTEATSTALLFTYLEASLGTARPHGLVTGLFALSGQPRHPDLPRAVNEPDWLDVLRESLDDDRADFAHRMNAFAAARARIGSPDGALNQFAWLGHLARVVPDWDLRVSSLPRRVASKLALEPLGLVAVRVDVDVPTQDLSLAMRAEWEGPGPFTWTVVKLDAADREIGRLDLAFEPRVTNAEKRIVALDGVRSLLVLGVNLGGIDATHLLDPDHAPFEPHGCTLYVARI